ncbi:MAG: flavodoxin family protein [Bacteroidales bacterium]|nr:flavodoxin family protein [Clostridium sp.]MCM1204506.1 flavodoxin family protein [Bacteroidales bacterium]
MKVLLVNGSPNEKGCTYTALSEIAKTLESRGIAAEIFHIGNKSVRGCIGCGACRKREEDGCVFNDDAVNRLVEKVKNADGYVFGSPVYYASPNGAMLAVMDRLFYSAGKYMQYKPAACIASARRAGTTATYDVLNKYIGINNMLMVPAGYWNMVHGTKPEEVTQDLEGMQIMRTLGNNMAWMLKLLDAGRKSGIEHPGAEEKITTNFIRS